MFNAFSVVCRRGPSRWNLFILYDSSIQCLQLLCTVGRGRLQTLPNIFLFHYGNAVRTTALPVQPPRHEAIELNLNYKSIPVIFKQVIGGRLDRIYINQKQTWKYVNTTFLWLAYNLHYSKFVQKILWSPPDYIKKIYSKEKFSNTFSL